MSNHANGKIIKMVQTLLEVERRTTEITPALISKKLSMVLPLSPEWLEADKDYLVDELVRRNSISSGTFHKLGDDTNHVKWYSKDQRVDRHYWDRYRSYLDESLPWSAIEGIDEITDSVMADIESPLREGAWDRRGLVVGHVQSGKTSNYTGLICKAADAGYKIIIVLAGLHNNLRAQTQARLDEGFLGYETNPDLQTTDLGSIRRIGVGEINKDPRLRPQWVTTRLEKGDFKASIAQNLGITPEERPWLFVVKKQKNILTSLLKWLREHVADCVDPETGQNSIGRLPLLIIDDEADNASVDTGEQEWDAEGNPDRSHEPKAINSLIRQILTLFQKKAYIGYTATPFANIFIHEKGQTSKEGDDLFPSAFIYNIPTPSNYIGPAKIFGTVTETGRNCALPLTVVIDDHTDDTGKKGWMPPKHNKHHTPCYLDNSFNLPPSLVNAIDSFILACSSRNLRGMESKHSSMLIHVTRLQYVQDKLKNDVHTYIQDLKRKLKRGIGDEEIQERMKRAWVSDFLPKTEQINNLNIFDELPMDDWDKVWVQVIKVLDEVEVRAINGSAKDALDYVDSIEAKRIIAIGGDKLSRGLTLEGLVTSYFLRASKMYDTLMQMGRWFGYRDGYIDLCRLYTTVDLIEWFEHITDAAEELRGEFDYMEQTGATPKEYGLKVRSHPTLLVTSRLKMRNGSNMQLSFSGDGVETVSFKDEPETIKKNYHSLINLISNCGPSTYRPEIGIKKRRKNAHLWKSISSEIVVDFLAGYTAHESSFKANTSLLVNFIEDMNKINELTTWNVAFVNGSGEEKKVGEYELKPSFRKVKSSSSGRISIGRLLQSEDETIDLTVDEWVKAAELSNSNKTISGPAIRNSKALSRGPAAEGLLLLYIVTPLNQEDNPLITEYPLVGFGIGFPSSNSGRKVTYVVNAVGQDDYV